MSDSAALDISQLTRKLDLPEQSVAETVRLLDEGNTVPFITRYRRDQTGGLDEQQIDRGQTVLRQHRQLSDRKQTILRSVKAQNKLTEDLRSQIEKAADLKRLEDLYLPFKPKKESLASKARDAGLGPLAGEILAEAPNCVDLDKRAADFVNEDKGVNDIASALLGAGHVLTEQFSERADVRGRIRKLYRGSGQLRSTKLESNEKKNRQYKDYLDYREHIHRIPPHRVLAINRGEKSKVLRVKIEVDEGAISQLATELLVKADHEHKDFLTGCTKDMVNRLLLPSLEREIRREMSEKAETHAISVFAKNLRNLLLQPPLPGRRVLAIDPGFKAGCKLAAINETGELLDHGLVYIVGSEEKTKTAREKIVELIRQHQLQVVAIGNGTACRQIEELIATTLSDELQGQEVEYIIVNEAGASVYSTSEIGREELPDCDPMQRSAVSIGRRLQDPLSEFVKIDPASIGVGLYQHDAKAKHLSDMLDEVVQSCVSYVGVDLNTASAALLRYVSGMNQLTARKVCEHRRQHGPFRNRAQLLEVSSLGDATFVQAAGFLKIEGGDNPFDGTWIHPENYAATTKFLDKLSIDHTELTGKTFIEQLQKRSELNREELASELEIGKFTLESILDSLSKPGRDPRDDLPPPIFRRDIVKFEQLQPGMELRGTVLNVVDFGAFVDVGLPDSGLVHISQLSNGFVRDPHSTIALGDQVRIWVASIDQERHRVALTMIEPGTEKPPEQRYPKRKQTRQSSTENQKPERPVQRGKKRSTNNGSKRPYGKKGQRQPSRPTGPHSYEKRATKNLVPISKDMEEGKESMRSFGDLLQYHQKKTDQDPPDPSKK